jgi:hypothetical protein
VPSKKRLAGIAAIIAIGGGLALIVVAPPPAQALPGNATYTTYFLSDWTTVAGWRDTNLQCRGEDDLNCAPNCTQRKVVEVDDCAITGNATYACYLNNVNVCCPAEVQGSWVDCSAAWCC